MTTLTPAQKRAPFIGVAIATFRVTREQAQELGARLFETTAFGELIDVAVERRGPSDSIDASAVAARKAIEGEVNV